jgi:hypothetical protein
MGTFAVSHLCNAHKDPAPHALSASGWSWGCVSAVDSNGRTIWIVDAHRDDGRRFVVRAVASESFALQTPSR